MARIITTLLVLVWFGAGLAISMKIEQESLGNGCGPNPWWVSPLSISAAPLILTGAWTLKQINYEPSGELICFDVLAGEPK